MLTAPAAPRLDRPGAAHRRGPDPIQSVPSQPGPTGPGSTDPGPAGRTRTGRIPVHLRAGDAITRVGLASHLRSCPDLTLVDDHQDATVTVLVTDDLTGDALRVLRALRRTSQTRIVVVTASVADADLAVLLEVGITALVRRDQATAQHLASAIRKAAAGHGTLPPDLLGRVLNQIGRLHRDTLAPRGLRLTGLTEREIEVLKLIADGYDTAEIAVRLCYSVRTVKNVLHDITSRHQLRNRSHAVAYAIRHGLI